MKVNSAIPQKPRITFEYLQHLYNGVNMEATIIALDKIIIRGVSDQIHHIQSPEFLSNLKIIPKLWEELRSNPETEGLQKISTIDLDLEYFAGVLVKDSNELNALEKRGIPAGTYADFLHRGPMSGINNTMNYIYGSWFPRSGRKRGNGPDLSFHTEKTNPSSMENEVRILIPLI